MDRDFISIVTGSGAASDGAFREKNEKNLEFENGEGGSIVISFPAAMTGSESESETDQKTQTGVRATSPHTRVL